MKRSLSSTPRSNLHSRKVEFSLLMRKKFSENWMEIRKEMRAKKMGTKRKAGAKKNNKKPTKKSPRKKSRKTK